MNFEKLTDEYKRRFEAHLLQIKQNCTDRIKSMPLKAPSYTEEVLIPIYQSLAAKMKKRVKIPDPQTYLPIKDYYRVKVGVTTVGGISVPENGDYAIYFTPTKNAYPVGEKQKVANTDELIQLITNQLNSKRQQAP